jgi:hypothetical protein
MPLNILRSQDLPKRALLGEERNRAAKVVAPAEPFGPRGARRTFGLPENGRMRRGIRIFRFL